MVRISFGSVPFTVKHKKMQATHDTKEESKQIFKTLPFYHFTLSFTLKFTYSEKATNFYEISTVVCSNGQIYIGDFAKFCGLLRIYELYNNQLLISVLEHEKRFSRFFLTNKSEFS